LAVSLDSLTQVLLQLVNPLVGQTHSPAAHVSPAAQVTPQPPQFFESVMSATQTPLQLIPPVAHWRTQTLFAQTSPAVQVTPQPPQLFGSVSSLTHVPLRQMVHPLTHPCASTPASEELAVTSVVASTTTPVSVLVVDES
jgi:hypothetical protein